MEESIGQGGGAGAEASNSLEIAVPADGLKRSEIYHVVKDLIGFVLYVHQQIPETLQKLEDEFHGSGEVETPEDLTPTIESEARSSRVRKHKIREEKQGMRRRNKLMTGISDLLSSVHAILDEVPILPGLMLILGSTIIRPLYAYDIVFFHEKIDSGSSTDENQSKVAKYISRKAIRSLVSKGGGGSHSGPMKFFLLVKAPTDLKLPLHFLPKRNFKCHKKTVFVRLQFKCKNQKHCSTEFSDATSPDLIWFQCRHTVKGLTSNGSLEG